MSPPKHALKLCRGSTCMWPKSVDAKGGSAFTKWGGEQVFLPSGPQTLKPGLHDRHLCGTTVLHDFYCVSMTLSWHKLHLFSCAFTGFARKKRGVYPCCLKKNAFVLIHVPPKWAREIRLQKLHSPTFIINWWAMIWRSSSTKPRVGIHIE